MTVIQNQPAYVSPILALEVYWDKPFEELPDDLQRLVNAIGLDRATWNAHEAQERKRIAEYFDAEHNPEREDERQRAWDVWCECDQVKREIAAWETVAIPTALDKATRDVHLQELHRRLKELEAQLDGRSEPAVEAMHDNDTEKEKRTRVDAMSVEIEKAIREIGGSWTPHSVMAKLRAYASQPNSCVVEVYGDGVTWRSGSGEPQKLNMATLRKRLSRRNKRTEDTSR